MASPPSSERSWNTWTLRQSMHLSTEINIHSEKRQQRQEKEEEKQRQEQQEEEKSKKLNT